MNKRQGILFGAIAAGAIILLILGMLKLIISDSGIANMVTGASLLAVGVILLVFSLEYRAMAKKQMNPIPQPNRLSVTGVIFSVVVTAGFVWAGVQWLNRDSVPQATAYDMQTNELHAFQNLQLISQSQKKYKETDWDGDGKKTYADYFVHLWTSVSTKSQPIRVDLISKKLSFASEASRAIDGYYFVDLHSYLVLGDSRPKSLDYQNQWAVMGLPVENGKTGVLNFIADQSGAIFVNPAKFVPQQYPENLVASGWTKIDTAEQLKNFQKKIVYRRNEP